MLYPALLLLIAVLVLDGHRRDGMLSSLFSMFSPLRNAPGDEGGRRNGVLTPTDVVVVSFMLSKARRLPPDIVQVILDLAGYWAHSSSEVVFTEDPSARPAVVWGNTHMPNKFLLRSCPVGLIGVGGDQDRQRAYQRNEPGPRPLTKEHDPLYFSKLAKYPTPLLANPVRKIVFSVRMHDQGWGGRGDAGTYHGSWTWCEVGLERFDASQVCEPHCKPDSRQENPASYSPAFPVCALRPLHPDYEMTSADPEEYRFVHPMQGDEDWLLQRNLVAQRSWRDYEITWSYLDSTSPETDAGQALAETGRGRGTGTGELVRGLKMGDVVSVWAKARFPGWTNHVERIKIEVYWAI